ncbi:MAG: hypothetical protein IBX67_01460 [Dehalococcoidia bacterium]|nr:hypothetical protein [Dehalococcoidia bacterium]
MGGKAKTEKMSITLPGELAGQIRSIVPRGEISSFLTHAVEHYIAYQKQAVALEKGFGAWKRKNHPDLATPEESTAYVRSIRKSDNGRLERLGNSDAKQ